MSHGCREAEAEADVHVPIGVKHFELGTPLSEAYSAELVDPLSPTT